MSEYYFSKNITLSRYRTYANTALALAMRRIIKSGRMNQNEKNIVIQVQKNLKSDSDFAKHACVIYLSNGIINDPEFKDRRLWNQWFFEMAIRLLTRAKTR